VLQVPEVPVTATFRAKHDATLHANITAATEAAAWRRRFGAVFKHGLVCASCCGGSCPRGACRCESCTCAPASTRVPLIPSPIMRGWRGAAAGGVGGDDAAASCAWSVREAGAGAASAEAEAAVWPEVAVDAVEEQEEWLGAAIRRKVTVLPAAAARAGIGHKKTPGPARERIDSVSAVAETWRARRAECVGAGGAAGSAGRQEAVRPEYEKVALETKELGRLAIVEHERSSSAQNEQYVACFFMYCVRLLAAAAHPLKAAVG
jgi:hypothetical protein